MTTRRDERNRILDMLASGKITAEQAAELLKAIGPGDIPPPPPPPGAADAFDTDARAFVRPKEGIARMLRISIDAVGDGHTDRAKIRVNVPLALARFATKFMPDDAKDEFKKQGINLNELLDALGDELPEGRLVDIDAEDDGSGKNAKIIVEVV